jgi:hypothetical protein
MSYADRRQAPLEGRPRARFKGVAHTPRSRALAQF